MNKIINFVNLLGWTAVLFLVTYKVVNDPVLFAKSDITFEVNLLKIVQSFMVVDILLILIGWSKGSLLGSLAQIAGRLIVALYFLTPNTDQQSFAFMTIIWSIADINRYLYYVVKNPLTKFLRYNSFIILYPVGVYGEMCVINDYIKYNASTITLNQINFARFVQACILIGVVFLYIHMLKMRSKSMRPERKSTEQQGNKSPKGKRQ